MRVLRGLTRSINKQLRKTYRARVKPHWWCSQPSIKITCIQKQVKRQYFLTWKRIPEKHSWYHHQPYHQLYMSGRNSLPFHAHDIGIHHPHDIHNCLLPTCFRPKIKKDHNKYLEIKNAKSIHCKLQLMICSNVHVIEINNQLAQPTYHWRQQGNKFQKSCSKFKLSLWPLAFTF